MGSPTLQTLQDPILLCFESAFEPNRSTHTSMCVYLWDSLSSTGGALAMQRSGQSDRFRRSEPYLHVPGVRLGLGLVVWVPARRLPAAWPGFIRHVVRCSSGQRDAGPEFRHHELRRGVFLPPASAVQLRSLLQPRPGCAGCEQRLLWMCVHPPSCALLFSSLSLAAKKERLVNDVLLAHSISL
jgi:hypothetical protein